MSVLRRLSLFGFALVPLLVFAACGDGGDDLDTDYPSAGEDRFESTTAAVEIEVTVPGAAALPFVGQLERVELVGPALITRSDPQDSDDDGLVDIQTEIVEMELTGMASFGEVIVRPHPDQPSLGMVEQQEPGVDFPADSFFDVFVEVELPHISMTAVTEEPMRMEATLTALPPGEGDEDGEDNVYRLSTGEAVPLIAATEASLMIGRISDAIHIPNPPPEEGETPEATPTEETQPTPTEAPAAQTVRLTQSLGCNHLDGTSVLLAIIRAFLRGGGEIPLEGATIQATASGPGVNPDEATQSGVTDANGEVLLSFGINLFGTYTTTVDSIAGPDPTPLQIDPSSDIMATSEVGAVCEEPS